MSDPSFLPSGFQPQQPTPPSNQEASKKRNSNDTPGNAKAAKIPRKVLSQKDEDSKITPKSIQEKSLIATSATQNTEKVEMSVFEILQAKPELIPLILKHYNYRLGEMPPPIVEALKQNCTKFCTLIIEKPIGSQELEKIGAFFPNINSLGLWSVTDNDLVGLASFSKLTALNLSGCDELTDAIGPHLAKLTKLNCFI